jgi:quinol monooxygenase YgiN
MTEIGVAGARSPDPSFFTVTYVEAVPPSAAQAASLLTVYREARRIDDGLVSFEVMRRLDRPSQFTVLCAWTNGEAFDTHAAGSQATRLNRDLEPILAAPNDTRQHTGLAVGGASVVGRAGITAVTHVDVVPAHKDGGMAALARLAEEGRKHPGNLRFDVWQQANRPNHFTVVETWSSRRAFDSHAVAAETRGFRTQLALMTGALYDERLYRPLA